MLYYAEAPQPEEVDGGIQITGSHNPPPITMASRWYFWAGRSSAPISRSSGKLAADGAFASGTGAVTAKDILSEYVERLLEGLAGIDAVRLKGLRVGWDAGERGGRPRARGRWLRGCRGNIICCLPKLTDIFRTTILTRLWRPTSPICAVSSPTRTLDFGVAFDGDGDRIGAIDGTGRVIWGDQLLMIYSEDLLKTRPGSTIIADVKASRALFDPRRGTRRGAADVEDRPLADQVQNEGNRRALGWGR